MSERIRLMTHNVWNRDLNSPSWEEKGSVKHFERYSPEYYLPISDHSPAYMDIELSVESHRTCGGFIYSLASLYFFRYSFGESPTEFLKARENA